MYICHDRCINVGTRKICNISAYERGYKYCKVCGYWFKTTDLRCMCCAAKLRNKAKLKKNRNVSRI